MKYILLDLERSINLGRTTYWKANRIGYTSDISEAGLYHEVLAKSIVKSDYDKRTIMINVDVVERLIR